MNGCHEDALNKYYVQSALVADRRSLIPAAMTHKIKDRIIARNRTGNR